MAKRQITLSEEKLRNFISYSVARLLKEAYGKPIYDRHGEYDGYEDSKYGSDSFVFEPDIDKYLDDDVDFPEYPKVKVYFTRTEGMKGDGYLQPDDPDEYELDSWEIVNREEMTPEVIDAVKQYMENDFDVEEAASEYGDLYEENRGVMAHFSGEGFQPKNPYENMTWDEYCAAKAREREEDAEKKKLHDLNYPEDEKDREKNRGIMTHVPGKKDDNIKITQQDLAEMIRKAVCQLKESLSIPGYDAWKTRTPYDDEPDCISEEDFFERIAQDGDPDNRYNQCKEFLEWLANYDEEAYEKVMQENQATGENVFGLAMNNGIDWKEIAREFYDLAPVRYYKDDMYESAGKKKPVNEISKGLLDRAREAAHKDMMRNFGDYKTRQKRERQWNKFTDEYGRLDSEERDSICPHVDEADLVNMPEDTYVVMNGDGRDAVSANFRTSYSGRAGTKEQCEEYVKRFYDMGANWEYLPEIVPLEDYLNSKRRR